VTGKSPPPAKKSLGQNFLVSDAVAIKIVSAVSPSEEELVFEIGPGRGALTGPLAESGARIVAFEIDESLVGLLRERFGERENVEVIHADIRDIDLDAEAATRGVAAYAIVGNIPYHLTSTILLDLPRWEGVSRAVLTVQREVGERIRAEPGDRNSGILSVYLGSYLGIERVARVRPGSFEPRPGVESVVLRFVPGRHTGAPDEREAFLSFLKGCFSQRRKKLKSALRAVSGTAHASVVKSLGASAGVDLDRRPEELDLGDWFRLFDRYREITDGQ
jgi:16S rRNA (adenine1518-N6/adenine1519-N6)-dimethyltransferase